MSRYAVYNHTPMGINNLNQLVDNQLGQGGYEVVRTIYDNIQWLSYLYQNIENLKLLGNNTYKYDILIQQVDSINKVANNLECVLEVNSHIPFVIEILPKLTAFTKSVSKLNESIQIQKEEIENLVIASANSIKQIKDLFIDYESKLGLLIQEVRDELCQEKHCILEAVNEKLQDLENFHEEVEKLYPILVTTTEQQNKLNKDVHHLLASDAVTFAIFSKQDKDIKKAVEAIKLSERLGNDETDLKYRFENLMKNQSVLELLKENSNEN